MQIFAPLVGARFRPPAKQVLAALGMDEPLVMRREPLNEHDANAIAVYLPEGWSQRRDLFDAALEAELQEPLRMDADLQLGYVKATEAEKWAPVFDAQGLHEVPCTLSFDAQGRPMVALEIPDESNDQADTGSEPGNEDDA